MHHHDSREKTESKILCDSYMEKCVQTGREHSVQLSFYDLSKARELMEMVDLGAGELLEEYDHTKNSFQFFNGVMLSRVSDSGKDANLIDLWKHMSPWILTP